jgi:hypothetical protein
LNQDESRISSNFIDVNINDPVLADRITPDVPTKLIEVNLSQISISLDLKNHSTQYSKDGLKKTFNTDPDFFKETVINLNTHQSPDKDGVVTFSLVDNHLLYKIFIQLLLNQAESSLLSSLTVRKVGNDYVLTFSFTLEALNILNDSTTTAGETVPNILLFISNRYSSLTPE